MNSNSPNNSYLTDKRHTLLQHNMFSKWLASLFDCGLSFMLFTRAIVRYNAANKKITFISFIATILGLLSLR